MSAGAWILLHPAVKPPSSHIKTLATIPRTSHPQTKLFLPHTLRALPQVACYEHGQHFLSHEDAFHVRLARANSFNRHATLLMYLNDVPQV